MIDLRKKREINNLTQGQLAEKVGISRQAISHVECCITKPTIENAKKLAEILGFDWTEFYTND